MQFLSILKKLSFIISVCGILSATSFAFDPNYNERDELALTKDTAPVYKMQETDVLSITETGGFSLKKARMGTLSISHNSSVLWYFSDSHDLYAIAGLNNTWKTFKVALGTSFSTTVNIDLTEIVRDGVTNLASPYGIRIILNKTGDPADLTLAQLVAFLRSSTTRIWLASTSGTILTSYVTLPTGWVAKAFAASDAGYKKPIICSLEDIETILSLSVKPVLGPEITFTSALHNLHLWNVTTTSTKLFDMIFTDSHGRIIKFKVNPANLARTSGTVTSLLANRK